jgi:hypothetical protein
MLMKPPKTRERATASHWQEGLLSWNAHALSIFGHLGVDPTTGDLPVPERERRIADFKLLFGDPTMHERKMTVPAGSIVIKHNDIVHRRCRSGEDGVTDEGVAWRPMWGLGGWTRLCDPTPGSLLLADGDDIEDDGGFALTEEEAACPESTAKKAVWESILSWMQGEGPTPRRTSLLSEAEVAELAAHLVNSESETQRVGSAYQLGFALRQADAAAADAQASLVSAMVHDAERVRRAATWAFGVGGQSAVPSLLQLVVGDASQLTPLQQQEVKANAAYALGIAVEYVTADAVDTLEGVLRASAAALDERVAGLAVDEHAELEASFDRGARGTTKPLTTPHGLRSSLYCAACVRV